MESYKKIPPASDGAGDSGECTTPSSNVTYRVINGHVRRKSMDREVPASPSAEGAEDSSARSLYMAYHGDLFRHYIRNYWHEVGTKFDDCGTKFVEISTKYNPEVIKYRP